MIHIEGRFTVILIPNEYVCGYVIVVMYKTRNTRNYFSVIRNNNIPSDITVRSKFLQWINIRMNTRMCLFKKLQIKTSNGE